MPSSDQLAHQFPGDRRQQDTIAVVAGSDNHVVQARGAAQDRPASGRVGTQACPEPAQRRLADPRNQSLGAIDQQVHGLQGDVLIVTDKLNSGAQDQLTVLAGNQVMVVPRDDVMQLRRANREHLALSRLDWNSEAEDFTHLARP